MIQFLYRANKGRVYFVQHLRDMDAFVRYWDADYMWKESYGGFQCLMHRKI